MKCNLITIAVLLLAIAGCKKQTTPQPATQQLAISNKTPTTAAGALACAPGMFNLAVDPATGFSYLYKVSGSPSAGPIVVSPVLGSSGTNQLTTCTGAPILFATGLAYDPSSGIFYGTTGVGSSPANHILRFTDPNCVSTSAAVASCAITLNLSDVERDPVTGGYYAINRGTANPNNRIVRLGLPGGPTVSCLPNFISPGINMRGLTFDCNGRMYAMQVFGTNGNILSISTGTGAIISSFAYPGAITPSPGVNIPEMGLHFDCLCIKQFITGNYHPTTLPPLMTDGLPTGLGGPLYAATSAVLKPTVDFARP